MYVCWVGIEGLAMSYTKNKPDSITINVVYARGGMNGAGVCVIFMASFTFFSGMSSRGSG